MDRAWLQSQFGEAAGESGTSRVDRTTGSLLQPLLDLLALRFGVRRRLDLPAIGLVGHLAQAGHAVEGRAQRLLVGLQEVAHHLAAQPLRDDAREDALPVDDASCDAIFCAFGIRNLSDLGRACAEQARALRPGGKLVVLDFFRPDSLGTRIVHAIYNRGVLPWVGWAVTGDREAYQYLPRSIGRFDSTDEYAARLRDAGFVDVRVEGLTMGVASIVRATRSA